MKKSIRQFLPAIIAIALLLIASGFAVSDVVAQTSANTTAVATNSTETPALVTAAEAVATPFIVSFAQSHAWLATIIALVGTLRLIFKPIVTAVEIYVKNTPKTEDDAIVEKVEASIWWKILYWLLDWGASIKAGTQAAATTTTAAATTTTTSDSTPAA